MNQEDISKILNSNLKRSSCQNILLAEISSAVQVSCKFWHEQLVDMKKQRCLRLERKIWTRFYVS